jgi:hypothetical protein
MNDFADNEQLAAGKARPTYLLDTSVQDKNGLSLPSTEVHLVASRAVYCGLFLVSFCTLLFEVVLTRIFSATMWYHFAFMVLSLVMFGMTIGAVIVYRLPGLLSYRLTGQHLSVFSGLFAILMVASLVIFLQEPIMPFSTVPNLLNFLSGDFSRPRILLAYGMFTMPFIFSGICTCLCLTRFRNQVSKLYAVDLIGASLACIIVVPFLSIVDAPSVVLLNAGLAALGACFFAQTSQSQNLKRATRVTTAILLIIAIANAFSYHHGTPGFGLKYANPHQAIVFEKWSPSCYVKVENRPSLIWGWGLDPAFGAGRSCEHYWVAIDSRAGTPLYRFDGDLKKIDFLKFDVSNIVHSIRPTGDLFVIGAGCGKDVLGAMLFDHKHIVGAEFNTAVFELLHNTFRSYSGQLDRWPGVELVNQEARTYLASTNKSFDIIQGTLAFTGSATQCGGLALTENGLYTVEAWRNFLSYLSDSGIMSFTLNYSSRQPFCAYKLCGLACEVLQGEKVRDHLVLIGTQEPFAGTAFSYATMLISKKPFSAKELDTLEQVANNIHCRVILSPRTCADAGLLSIIDEKKRPDFYARYGFDVKPTTDDRPFFFCGSKVSDYLDIRNWQNILAKKNTDEDPLVVLFSLFLTIGTLTAVCVLLPLSAPMTAANLRDSIPLAIFFASIGLGFMMVEISQMERLSIFLGHPIFGLTVVLFTVLLASGLGSLSVNWSFAETRNASFSRLVCLLLALLVLGWLTPFVTQSLATQSIPIRVISSALLLAVPGFLMGMPLPLGLLMANPHRGVNLSAWLWGINGAMSVLGSILATIVSICAGIQATFLIGVGCYFVCFLSFIWFARRSPAQTNDIAESDDRLDIGKLARNVNHGLRKALSNKPHRAVLPALTLLGIATPFVPWLNLMTAPIDLLTGISHQLAHITISIMGGLPIELMIGDDKLSLTGSILKDGGLSFLYAQSGYLLLLSLACLAIVILAFVIKDPSKLSKSIILSIGGVYAAIIGTFTVMAIFQVGVTPALACMICVFIATAYYVFASFRFDSLPFKVLLAVISIQSIWLATDTLMCLSKSEVGSNVVAAAHANDGQRLWIGHREIAHWGDLACAIAVCHVLRDAGIPIDDLSVSGLSNQLYIHGWRKVSFQDRRAGDVIIAMGREREHSGIVDFDLNTTFANHSSSRRWGRDQASYWVNYPGLTELYVLRAPSAH